MKTTPNKLFIIWIIVALAAILNVLLYSYLVKAAPQPKIVECTTDADCCEKNPSTCKIGKAYIPEFPNNQTFCEVNTYTGSKRQYTVKEWDDSTLFDTWQGMREGNLIPLTCKKVKLQKNIYCKKNLSACWSEFDIIN